MDITVSLNGDSFFEGPVWLVMTQFVMPALAIFFSGYLAVRLQCREHLRQERQRLTDEDQTRKSATEREIARRLDWAIDEHQIFISWALDSAHSSLVEVARLTENAPGDFIFKDEPGLSAVGVWIASKRARVVSHINDAGHGFNTSVRVAEYFGDAQVILRYWQLGAFDYA